MHMLMASPGCYLLIDISLGDDLVLLVINTDVIRVIHKVRTVAVFSWWRLQEHSLDSLRVKPSIDHALMAAS